MNTSILNDLLEFADPNLRWVCRQSSTGRGLRIHQTIEIDGIKTYDSPEAAIKAFLNEQRNSNGNV